MKHLMTLSGFLLCFGLPAHAHAYHWSCVAEYLTPLRTIKEISKECVEASPLKLTSKFQSYPKLRDNPRQVRYWEGKYTRTVTEHDFFLRELVDTCRGKIISSSEVTYQSSHELPFGISNPNLDPGISESYMLTPMTEEEAQNEMAEALERCMQQQMTY